MATVYIDHAGSTLRTDAGVLVVDIGVDGTRPTRLPLGLIERVVIRAEVTLTSSVLCALTEAGVSVVMLAGRRGERVAHTVGAWHNDASVRVAQCIASVDVLRSAALALHFVARKVARQRASIDLIAAARPDLRKVCFDASATLGRSGATLTDTPAGSSTLTVESLRGLEGAAAAAYFPAYFAAFPPSLGARNRKRRPPPDPVNATLSLAYTLLASIAVRACCTVGLDPAVGFLHGLSHGRASMACDLMEPWRPAVDVWVWQQFQSRELRAEHFGNDGSGACLLGKAGRAHFYRAFEPLGRRLEWAMRRHARLIGTHLLSQSPVIDAVLTDFESDIEQL